jgi:hypothetical protein
MFSWGRAVFRRERGRCVAAGGRAGGDLKRLHVLPPEQRWLLLDQGWSEAEFTRWFSEMIRSRSYLEHSDRQSRAAEFLYRLGGRFRRTDGFRPPGSDPGKLRVE